MPGHNGQNYSYSVNKMRLRQAHLFFLFSEEKNRIAKMRLYMAENEGFEPPHAFTSSGFRNRPLQPLG